MIVLFSSDEALLDTFSVAVRRTVPVQLESDHYSYRQWKPHIRSRLIAVVVDCRSPRKNHHYLVGNLAIYLRTVPILAIAPHDSTELGYLLGAVGCAGVITEPLSSVMVRKHLLDMIAGTEQVGGGVPWDGVGAELLLGKSEAMRRLRRVLAKVADSREPVLILGETGAGKDLVAKVIHQASSRSDGPFVPANIPSVSSSLFESELFGSTRGAYTGARDRPGLFRSSDGGTLFLDEIADLPLSLQPKLLRAVESCMIRPVGDDSLHAVDTRVISATNRNLRGLVSRGRFREDLWYRLGGLQVPVPALRERIEDLPELCDAILSAEGFPAVRLLPDALRMLRTRRWPGNVRELRHVLVRSATLADGDNLRSRDLVFDGQRLWV